MVQLSSAMLPANPLYLSRLASAFFVGVILSLVIVIPRLRGQSREYLSVECPVRQITAMYAIRQRRSPHFTLREPPAAVQPANRFANLRLADFEREHALRAKNHFYVLVSDQLRRAAKIAILRDALRVEDRNGVAALTLDRDLLRLPTPPAVRNVAQRHDQIMLDDFAVCADLRRRSCSAVGANQRLFRRVPLGLRAARGTGVFLLSDCFLHRLDNDCRPKNGRRGSLTLRDEAHSHLVNFNSLETHPPPRGEYARWRRSSSLSGRRRSVSP